jgi:hypothetical protein
MKLKSHAAIIVMLILTVVLFTFPKVEAGSKIIVVPEDSPQFRKQLATAADGDIVLVKNGFYLIDETSTIVINKTLSLIGEDPASTVILGASTTCNDNGMAISLAIIIALVSIQVILAVNTWKRIRTNLMA